MELGGGRMRTQTVEDEMNRIDYGNEIWALKDPHPALSELLTSKDCLIIIKHGKPPFKVVIGVPHQAAVGEPKICRTNRDSDENAASYALVTFTTLRENNVAGKLVIAAHSKGEDPNKDDKSLYWKEIFSEKPDLLLECHGSSENRKLDIELSAGPNNLTRTIEYGKILSGMLKNICDLGVQKLSGGDDAVIFRKDGSQDDDGKLERAGNKTDSLQQAEKAGIQALHVEAKPRFRIPQDKTNKVTPDGLILGRALAKTIIQYMEKHEHDRPGKAETSGADSGGEKA
jgi:hypothetical protein